jgi:AcrR family transcriptional regulator
MRQAAKAAHLSLGGLYHYFPTKRDLVVHSLKPEALARVCTDFHDRHAQWERTDHSRYVEANIAYMARQCAFIRPAFQAALDLDAEIAWDHIRAGIDACTRPLTLALPTCTPDEIDSLGRSVRRTFYSALVDHTVTRNWTLTVSITRRVRTSPGLQGW